MKTVAIIQARFDSSRLPGKVLAHIGGRPALFWITRAARSVPAVDQVVVATSDQSAEDPIVSWCKSNSVECHRGDKDDVLGRITGAALACEADVIMRLTADCPFLDPNVCDQIVYALTSQNLDFASNAHPSTWPDGLDCEVMTRAALEQAAADADLPSYREHVTPYIRANQSLFSQSLVRCPIPGLAAERWTLDTKKDLEFLDAVASHLPDDRPPVFTEVLSILDAHSHYREINAQRSSQALLKNVSADTHASSFGRHDYVKSAELLARAEQSIPLGSQTFSKSKLIFPAGRSPLFLSHGLGGQVWDVDGNAYVDYICGLLPILLGYCDPDVDAAIIQQLARGISFSLSTELEMQLAERLLRIVPCAEKVRFGKNGSDATSAAIRLARAFTGRDRVAVCGYHGWQDWYIGSTTRHKGVPGAVRSLTSVFSYGNLDALDVVLSEHPDEFAAVMMEPATFDAPPPGYLEGVRDIAHSHGALLIFDEVIAGFRFALGGAQELFGVTPDLAAFGKGMGNGMPISAVVGRSDVMQEMEEVFYSGTFGGEALSLAAAIATIDKLEREDVIPSLWSYGQALGDQIVKRIEGNGLDDVLRLIGLAPWQQLAITPTTNADAFAIRTFLMRCLLDHGVLMSSTFNVCHAHNDVTMELTLTAFDEAFCSLALALKKDNFDEQLDCKKIEPIFAIRPAVH